MIAGCLDSPLLVVDRTSGQGISTDTADANSAGGQLDVTDIYRTLHPATVESTFLSSVRGTFTKIDHTLAGQTSVRIFKRIQVIQSTFSDHRGIKLGINNRKRSGGGGGGGGIPKPLETK